MATFARVNGGALAGEFVGRDLKFVNVALTGIQTGYTAPESNFEKVVRVLEKYSTVTIVGTPAAGNAMFVVEGLPPTVNDNSPDQSGSTTIVAQLQTDANAATGGSCVFTVYNGLSGTSFA